MQLWRNPDHQLPLVFKSPTGSGKTFMMAHLINDLCQVPNWDYDKAFIWITFSDDMAMQSLNKFNRYFANVVKNDLLTVEALDKGKLKSNDILFINWQKLVSRAAVNRVLRRPRDPLLQKESGIYFEDFIDVTHDEGREIILVIDESHKGAGTVLAQEIIDYINPKIITSVSATPENEPSISAVRNNRAGYVEVDREEVVQEGLIKERIIVQSEEDLQKHGGEDLDTVLLDLGFEKRATLKKQFESLSKNVNPLMLIQLPNDDKELRERNEKTKEEIVLDYLMQKGIQGHQIALWFDNHKENLDSISENDSDVDFMLFKQAAGTGWDCPRAHVLLMFREITSPVFYVQTVGRILRMPEPDKQEDYKDSSDLRNGFLITNYRRNEVGVPDQSNKNKPFIYNANLKNERRELVKDFALLSAFISRVDYGDLADSIKFQASFLNTFNQYFGISNEITLRNPIEKLESCDINLNPTVSNELVVNAEFEDFDQLSLDFSREGTDVSFEMSHNDVEKTFNYLCYHLLKEQTDVDAKITNIARSWGPLKSALRVWLKKVLGFDSDYFYRVFIYDILGNENSKFRPAITQALKNYRPILNDILRQRHDTKGLEETPFFVFRDQYTYTEDYEEEEQNLCILDKCYLRKDYSGKMNETRFLRYIDSKDQYIEWWFKNGDHGKDYFALKYFNTRDQIESLFYPDWIIGFKSGKVGIFDTKSGTTAEDTEGRAQALALKLRELGDELIGGIAIFENGMWYYNCSEDYSYVKGRLDDNWKLMESIFLTPK